MTRSPRSLFALAMIAVVVAAPSARAAEPAPRESALVEMPKIEPQQIALAVDSFSIRMIDSIALIAPAIDSMQAIAVARAPSFTIVALDSVIPAIEQSHRHPLPSLALHLRNQPTARSALNRSSLIAAALTRRHLLI